MRVYPWRQRENHGDRKMVMKIVTSSSTVFRIVGGLLSLGTASLFGLLMVRRFAKRNDSWPRRGGLMVLGGLAVFIILGGPAAWAGALNDALLSFGDRATGDPAPFIIGFIVRSIAFGFFFQGFAVMMASYVYEVTGDRFLDRVKPTTKMKRRMKKNEAALIANDKPDPDAMAFGLLVDDPIPWRTARYGMICARPFKEMGHGVIVGGNGTGKTVLALSLAYQATELDASVFYIDFKASLRTLETVKKAAAKAGKPFYSFDLGTGSTENSWYDPLDWKGTSSEKASMIVNSLQFPEDGNAAYYRGQANDWLIFQFDVLQEVGLYPGESSFDFLYETTNPSKMKERLQPLRKGDDRQRSLYTMFTERADAGSMKDLAGLRQNLSIVVNAGGERLRPQSAAPAILMSRAVDEGAVVYFGLSPSTDQVALKTIGSLILRNLGVLAGERMRQSELSELRPIITLVDEASRLQDRAVVMDNLLATAREGDIYLWMITQSFATWPKSTVVEMNTNVQTHVAFRVQDIETAEHLVSTLGDVPTLEEMTEDKVRHRAFQGDVKERSGDARTTLSTGPFLVDAPMEITSVENLHAYVWFTGSWTRATIEQWSPKRLKKPDIIRNDAPLVRIVFMDYETEAEPPKETTFSDLVTSADEITYNMENTTLKRSRKESLTDEDYPNIHLPGSAGDGVQWGHAPADPFSGYGPDQGRGGEMGGPRITSQDEPMWDEAAGPRWDDTAPTNAPTPAPTRETGDDGLTWGSGPNEEDSDEPPVSHFYKPRRTAPPVPTEAPASAPQPPAPAMDEFASDAPAPGHGGSQSPDQAPAPVETDEDGIQWDSGPVGQPAASATPTGAAPVDDGFAPDHSGAAGAPVSEEPMWAEDAPGAETVGAGRDTGSRQGTPTLAQAEERPEKGGDVDQVSGYTGSPSHDDSPASAEGVTSPQGTVVPEPPKNAPGARSGQGRSSSSSASTSKTSVPASSAPEQGEGASAVGDAGRGTEGESGDSVKDQVAEKPQSKAPSRGKSKSRSKKNASDDWL